MKKTSFSDWHIGDNYAISPDKTMKLLIKFGFSYFSDHGEHALLVGLTFWKKVEIWKEFKKEMKIRADKFLSPNPQETE